MPASYEFDPFFLDPTRRLLLRDRKPVAITPKVFDLLLVLVRNRGRVLEKEELLALVWPNLTVEEANLSQSIFVLRRALGETHRDHPFITTAPGRGYSFIAEVRELDGGSKPPSQRAAGNKKRSAAWIAIAVGIVALGVMGALLGSRRTRAGDENPLRTVPFTTLPGGEYEPSFSPDGKQLAFVWNGERQDNFDIYTKPVAGGELRRITTDPAGDGSPAWSPDGQSIAFVRYSEIAKVSGVYLIPAAGGVEKKITQLFPVSHLFDRRLDWSPDGALLALADNESAEGPLRIYLVSPKTRERRTLTRPPAQLAGDSAPSFSPDGRTLAFRRTSASGITDLFLVPIAGGEPRHLTADKTFTSGYAWTPDSREIVFTSRRLGSPMLWRIPVSGGRPRPILGIGDGGDFLSISRNGGRLAYSRWFADTNIWRFRLAGGEGRQYDSSPVIASTLEDRSPQYSPDGSKIAFRSNRSGRDQIWTAGSDGTNPLQATHLEGALTGTPRWSPDGKSIAFDSRPEGNADIYVIGAAGGSPRRITTEEAEDVVPSWSHDGKWIYFASNRTGNWQVWKAPSQGESPTDLAVQVTRTGGFAAFESVDGKWLYYAKGRDAGGLWRVPVGGGEESLVISDLPPGYWGYWAIGRDGIYFLTPNPGGGCAVRFLSFATSAIKGVGTLPVEPPFGDSGISVSSDGRWLLYPRVDHSGSNIMLTENFR